MLYLEFYVSKIYTYVLKDGSKNAINRDILRHNSQRKEAQNYQTPYVVHLLDLIKYIGKTKNIVAILLKAKDSVHC